MKKRRFARRKPQNPKFDTYFIEIRIEKLANGAKGLGFHEGKVVFVFGALPGELIRAEVIKEKKDFIEARLDKIIESSPDRIEPKCKHYNECGGCDLQHLSYPVQIQVQKGLLLETLKRVGHQELSDIAIVGSPEWQYRSRARFWQTLTSLGFKSRQSSEVIDLEECPVLTSAIESHMTELKTKNPPQKKSKEISALAYKDRVLIGGEGTLEIKVLGKSFLVDNQVFFQSNQLILDQLVSWVLHNIPKGKYAIDLFSGVGFFASFIAEFFETVFAVERNSKCLQYAQVNCPSNVRFYDDSAEHWIQDHSELSVDFLIVDPPREGLDSSIIDFIHQCSPKTWVYVSCHPVTFARDLKRILAQEIYILGDIQGFDFYPQTSHMELAAKFIKKEP
jgi:23S rRNA (uracil1939-C5)-methyltransferase